MNSSLGWIVLDDRHKRDVMETIALLREPGTVDELGLGTVRDAFSDMLFPGTSVLQTRAKYLLFIPWIFDSVRRDGLSGEAAIRSARHREVALIRGLLAQERQQGKRIQGIIGRQAQASLKRMPSEIYWLALQRFGILRWHISVTDYCRSLRPSLHAKLRVARDEDGNPVLDDSPWAHLPEPEDHDGTATFVLKPDQASYLRDRISTSRQDSMLTWLLGRDSLEMESADAPWQHPALGQVPERLREVLDQARWFSNVAHGAALLYNLMLAEAGSRGDRDDLIARYSGDLEAWHKEVDQLPTLDPAGFWSLLNTRGIAVSFRTHSFLDRWFELVESGDAGPASIDARDLIRARERQLKRGRARLHNPRQLERWGGSSGVDPLTYRWSIAQTLVTDITAPLAHGGKDAGS